MSVQADARKAAALPLVTEDRWLARAFGLNLIGQAIPLISALVAVPIVVAQLDPSEFGVVALTWTVAGYFALLDLGLGRAITKLGAEALGAGDADHLDGLVKAAVRVQLGFGLLLGLLILVAAPAFVRMTRVPALLQSDAIASFRLLAIAVPAILITNTYRGALEAAQRFDLANTLRAVFGAAMYVLTIIGALLWPGTLGIVALIVTSRCLGAFAHQRAYRIVVPRATRVRLSVRERTNLLKFGGWVAATSALVPLVNYIDRFLIGGIVSIAAVGYYAVSYELAMKLLILPGSMASALLPHLSRKPSDRAGELRWDYERTFWWNALILLGPTAILFVLAPWVLDLWLGGAYAAESAPTLRVLVIAVYFTGLAMIPFTTLEALGQPKRVTQYHLIELPIYLAVTVALIRWNGIQGAAWAWLVRNIVATAVLSVLARRALRYRP